MPLPFVPSVVAEHLKKKNIELVRVGGSDDDSVPLGNSFFTTADGVQAFKDNSASTLQSVRQQNYADLKANLDDINQNAADAFVTTYDSDNNNQPFGLSASDNGWIWVYVNSLKSDPSSDDGNLVATVSCGSYSITNSWLGLSTTTLSNIATQGTIAIVTTVATTLVGKFISQRLQGATYDVAAAAASDAAETSVEDFLKVFPNWAATGLGLLGGSVVGFVAGLILEYILNLFWKSYGLKIQVTNWSTQEQWNVTDWYGDNADMDGPFLEGKLQVASGKIKVPHGFDTSKFHGYFATYTIENHSKFAEGVGMGLQVVSNTDPSRVIFLKYMVRWSGDNWLGLAVGTQNQTLSGFYNDSSSWASSGSTTASVTMPAGSSTTTAPETPVNCNTPALSGVSDDLYYFDVIIGTPSPTN